MKRVFAKRHLSHKFLCGLAMILLSCTMARAQKPDFSGIGKTPTPEEIKAKDISISPDGRELPVGHGTVKEGTALFAQKCAICHGPTGEESKLVFARLVGGRGTMYNESRDEAYIVETPGSFWPYATSIWDFINRAMPQVPVTPDSLFPNYLFTERPIPVLGSGMSGRGAGPMDHGEQLTPDQVYQALAYILWRNGIIKEDEVMDQNTVPKVVMPNRNGFLPPADLRWAWTRRDPKTRIEPHVAPASGPSNTKASPIAP